jgi:hypothetical protein
MSKTEEITPPVAAGDAEAPPPIDERYRIEKEIGRGGMGRAQRFHVLGGLLWVWLSDRWAGWRDALHLVRPETVIRWHRRRSSAGP